MPLIREVRAHCVQGYLLNKLPKASFPDRDRLSLLDTFPLQAAVGDVGKIKDRVVLLLKVNGFEFCHIIYGHFSFNFTIIQIQIKSVFSTDCC